MSTRYDDRDRDRSQRNSGRRSGQDDRSYGQSSQGGWEGAFEDEEQRYAGESRWRGQQYGTGRALYRGGGDYESRDWGSEGLQDDRDYSSERNRTYGSSGRGSSGGGYGGGSSSGSSRGGYSGSGGGYRDRSSGGYAGESGGGGYGSTRYADEYGSSYGAGYERGEGRYRDVQGGGGNPQRSTYGSGYRSDENYGERGRSYGDYGRGGYGESRGYEGRGYEGRGGRGEGEERGWWDRFSDTVAAWFGDEEAERRRQMERPYQGRGPKSYRRSDERIREDVNDRLSDGYLDATEIDVVVSSGEVVLSGTVDTRMDKRRAEDIADHVSGVTNVENRLRVRNRYQTGGYGTSTGAGARGTGPTGTSSMGTSATGTGTSDTSTTLGTAGTTGATGTTGGIGATGTSGTGVSSSSTGTSSGSARGRSAGS